MKSGLTAAAVLVVALVGGATGAAVVAVGGAPSPAAPSSPTVVEQVGAEVAPQPTATPSAEPKPAKPSSLAPLLVVKAPVTIAAPVDDEAAERAEDAAQRADQAAERAADAAEEAQDAADRAAAVVEPPKPTPAPPAPPKPTVKPLPENTQPCTPADPCGGGDEPPVSGQD